MSRGTFAEKGISCQRPYPYGESYNPSRLPQSQNNFILISVIVMGMASKTASQTTTFNDKFTAPRIQHGIFAARTTTLTCQYTQTAPLRDWPEWSNRCCVKVESAIDVEPRETESLTADVLRHKAFAVDAHVSEIQWLQRSQMVMSWIRWDRIDMIDVSLESEG